MPDPSIYQRNIQAASEKIEVPFFRPYTNAVFLCQPVKMVNPTHTFLVLCDRMLLGIDIFVSKTLTIFWQLKLA